MEQYLKLKGNFRNLIVFQKAECVYDITFHFTHRFLKTSDRTIDQMIQAARSGKQNIAEGGSSATTSRETEIKLLNVAKASFKELMLDYEDYLRVRELPIWRIDSEKGKQARIACAAHNDSAYYRQAIRERSDEAIANIALILIHQIDYLLFRLIEQLTHRFISNGSVREELIRARRQYKARQKDHL